MERLKLLIATNNPGKARDLAACLAGVPITIVRPADIGLELEIAETGATYAANARLKAEAFAERSGMLALADDSGLEIEVLGGWPGVRTARAAGEGASDAERRAFILRRLAGRGPAERQARFVCYVALAAPGHLVAEAHGTLEGRIAEAEYGSGGFGFDQIFIPEGYERTLAELSDDQKKQITHRARALRKLQPLLGRLARA